MDPRIVNFQTFMTSEIINKVFSNPWAEWCGSTAAIQEVWLK